MDKGRLITDKATRDAIIKLESKINAINAIKQLQSDASLKEVIDTINKITNSLKRK